MGSLAQAGKAQNTHKAPKSPAKVTSKNQTRGDYTSPPGKKGKGQKA
jgi:hypothetical protein